MVKLTAKKIYCPKCAKLSHVKLQANGERNEYVCLKCESVIWKKEGLKWKYVKAL